MRIILNDIPTDLPKEIKTISDLLNWKKIKPQGTAVAVNDKLLLKNDWNVRELEDMTRITVISAAFGG